MSHPSELQLSMHADSALGASESESIAGHVATCTLCAQRFIALEKEVRLIGLAFEADATRSGEITGGEPVRAIPDFSRPAGLREFALINLFTAALIWMVSFLWKTLFGDLVVDAFQVAASTYVPTTYEVVSTSVTYYLEKGTAMFSAYLGYVCLAVFLVTLLWWAGRLGRTQGATGLCLLGLFCGAGLVPESANALELRYGEDQQVVAADETIDDTLLIAAETVLIRGNITGDLMVVGERVEIDGSVGGNIIAFAETVVFRGSVSGTIISAGERVELREVTAGGDLWAAAEVVVVDELSKVMGNATVAGDQALVKGGVGKDLAAAADAVEFGGQLGGNLEAFADRVRLLKNARVAGNARLRLDNENRLSLEDGVQIDGQLEFLAMPEQLEPENRYAEPEFYLWQLARLVSAVLVGLALLWLFPVWRRVSVGAGTEGLKSAGIGLLALIALPVLGLLVAFTVVGLPFSFVAFTVWLVMLYLAKILVGIFVGRSLLAQTGHADNVLFVVLAGMSLVILVVNLPWIGGLVSLVITVVGAGLIVQRARDVFLIEERI